MDVESLHVQWLWPLRVHGLSEKGGLDECVRRLKKGDPWVCADQPFLRGPSRDPLVRYAEMAYFHPFVRALLFERGPAAGSVRALERDDVKGVEVVVEAGKGAVTLSVYRLQLYLFDTDVAVLAIGGATTDRLTIPDAEDLLDAIRRAYQSYWEFNADGTVNATERCHCPWKVNWTDAQGKQLGDASSYGDADAARKVVEDGRCEPPVSAHWAWMLQPLEPVLGEAEEDTRFKYRQVLDERIPLMAHIGVSRPEMLTRGDFARLALLDDRGASDTLPYGTDFLKDFEKKFCYDRFWDPTRREMHRTRYLCAGYSFVAVGEWLPPDNEWHPGFFMDERSGGLAHFKHHYFELGLLALLQEASLLNFVEELSDLAARHSGDSREKARKLKQRLTKFVALYWFTEVSNHEQAKELFDMWRGHLASERLYREVVEQIEFVDRVLADDEAAKQERSRAKQEQWRDDVSSLGGAAVAVTILGAFLGMSPFVDDWGDALAAVSRSPEPLRELWAWFSIAELLALVVIVCGAYRVAKYSMTYLRTRRDTDELSAEN